MPHKSIQAKHIPLLTQWLHPKVFIILRDLLGVEINLVTYDPLSSQSNPAEVHCQIDVGMDKSRCELLTPFRHSNSEFEVIGLGIPSGH